MIEKISPSCNRRKIPSLDFYESSVIKSSSISDIVIEKPVKDPSDLESWRRWEKGQNFMAAMKVIMPDGQSIRDRYLRRSISITYEFSKDQNFPGRMMQNASNIQERTSIFSRKEYVIMKMALPRRVPDDDEDDTRIEDYVIQAMVNTGRRKKTSLSLTVHTECGVMKCAFKPLGLGYRPRGRST
uniref:Uncharacterized protein n=1 Tax=Vespula pensylvanica TaxID=30213 RepID=A0A834P2L8_VESPE|nr:hypothetical protein H0235_008200 [Vespula pensylvanica]